MALGISCNKLFGTVSVNTLQGWLKAGDVSGSYSSFADVEADEAAVRKLMTKHASVDFLTAHSTDPLISQIINSDICAKWINLRDYALDTLSANTDIKELMDESDKKIEPLVPAMTSNTTPEGECIASYEYSNLPIWKAFDSGETSEDGWLGYSQAVNQYIGYKFTCPQNVKNFRLYIEKSGSNTFSDAHAVFEASNDGATWETISTHSLGSITTAQFYTFYFNTDNESSYLYYRVRFPEVVHIGGVGGMIIITLQFYGIKKTLMPLVPTMTSNTTPRGECVVSSNSQKAYLPFANNTSLGAWVPSAGETTNYITYTPETENGPIKRVSVTYRGAAYSGYTRPSKTFKIQGSNDGTTWTDIVEDVLPSGSDADISHVIDIPDSTFKRVRLYLGEAQHVANQWYVGVLSLQFYTYAPQSKYGYGEWALVGQVPKMTSNTAPYGVASASSANSGYDAYKAFDGVMGTSGGNRWSAVASDTNKWLQYQFISPIKISQIAIYPRHNTTYNITVKGSNDGTTFDDLTTFEITGDGADDYNKKFTIDIPENKQATYSYYRLSFDMPAGTSAIVGELQFYAWQPKGNVPVMTSNTAPYGEAITSSSNAYLAFDGNMSTNWGGADAPTYSNVGYKFVNPACVKKYTISFREDVDTKYRLQASNDGSTWTDITQEKTYSHTGSKEIIIEDVNNSDYYLYYRIYGVCTTNAKAMVVYRLQFYGRELSVSVPTMTSNTAPYGEVDVTNYISGGSHAGFKAFDGGTPSTSDHCWVGYDPNTSASYGGTSAPVSISYDFGKPVVVKQVSMKLANQSSGNGMEFTIDGYDGSDWIPLKSVAQKTPSGTSFTLYSYDVDNNVAYTKYRLNITKFFGSALYWGNTSQTNYWCAVVGALQFFGRDYSEREFADGSTIKYIYDHGIELEGLTDYIAEGSIEHGSDYIEVSGGNVIENNTTPIDLTLYNTMRMIIRDVYERGSTYYPYLRADTAPAGTSGTMLAFANIENSMLPNNISLDISSISQTAYIYSGYYKMATSESAKWRIHEWWLE